MSTVPFEERIVACSDSAYGIYRYDLSFQMLNGSLVGPCSVATLPPIRIVGLSHIVLKSSAVHDEEDCRGLARGHCLYTLGRPAVIAACSYEGLNYYFLLAVRNRYRFDPPEWTVWRFPIKLNARWTFSLDKDHIRNLHYSRFSTISFIVERKLLAISIKLNGANLSTYSYDEIAEALLPEQEFEHEKSARDRLRHSTPREVVDIRRAERRLDR